MFQIDESTMNVNVMILYLIMLTITYNIYETRISNKRIK